MRRILALSVIIPFSLILLFPKAVRFLARVKLATSQSKFFTVYVASVPHPQSMLNSRSDGCSLKLSHCGSVLGAPCQMLREDDGWGVGVRLLRWWWEWGHPFGDAGPEGVLGQNPKTERLWLGFGCAVSIDNGGQWSEVPS
jgi:hypothetical protein